MSKKSNKSYTNWYIAGAVILLMIGSMSFFVTNNIYDSQRFADKATAAITTEPAREAIAREVTTEILKDQSLVAQRVLTEPSVTLISSLLKTKAFSNIFYEFSNSLNRFLTTNNFEPVVIDISSITPTVDKVVDSFQPDNTLDLTRFEDEPIVLFESADLPPFRTIGQILLLLGPLSLLMLVVLLVASFKRATDKKQLLKHSGTTLMIAGTLLLVLTYTSGGLLTVAIIDPERSVLMQEIYNSFIANFRFTQFAMIILGGILYGSYYYLANDVKLSIKAKKN